MATHYIKRHPLNVDCSAMASPSGLFDPAKLFNVEGLVAVVTGGGSGIGLMIATALENNGAIVYIVSRKLDVLESAVRERSRRGNLFALQGDVTNRESLQRIAEIIKRKHGFINLLVNNAGVANNILPKLPGPGEADIKTYQNILWNAGTPKEFSDAFDVNVTAVYYCTVCFLELLHAGNKRGNLHGVTSQVLTVTSGGAFRKDDKVFSVSYTLSKVAATHLSKMLSHFLRDWKIRSNVIAPGIFPSVMTGGLISDAYVKNNVPLQRQGDINDIGGWSYFWPVGLELMSTGRYNS
ncbi:Rhamnolipids biosynthesis 3-oxoacyl-[acyl-carrier-protein] reductase [Grifola frondosa]|uniref:Rhamnolipids biosynthesis 3-oxoacyl-[acyl-carrier-protein] reductase n=1 Tax=Grifola frondosa TaxID=5627 RepID=A0A1C7M5H1_GRIFR|nr:Rhamnolipids biosynthesis 3-oxoacyl-[acyl-carrier-protein] reductase [Grifola frondosa]